MSFIKKFLSVLFLFICFQVAYAQVKLDVELEKQTFFSGEEVEAEIIVTNLENYPVNASIQTEVNSNSTYVPSEPCIQEVYLKPFENVTLHCEWEEGFGVGDYFIEVKETKTGIKTLKNFKVEEIPIQLLTCLDEKCQKQTSIFYFGEKACLSYINRSNQTFDFLLVYPNNVTKSLKLPVCLKLEKGIYELKAISDSKEFSKKFVVISSFGKKESIPLWPLLIIVLLVFIFYMFIRRLAHERPA